MVRKSGLAAFFIHSVKFGSSRIRSFRSSISVSQTDTQDIEINLFTASLSSSSLSDRDKFPSPKSHHNQIWVSSKIIRHQTPLHVLHDSSLVLNNRRKCCQMERDP